MGLQPMRLVLYASWVVYAMVFWSCIRPWLLFFPLASLGWAIILGWHVCFVMALVSLGVCAITAPARCDGAPPSSVAPAELRRLRELALQVAPQVPLRSAADGPRYCVWCQHWQPPRAQHCLLCRTCIAQQDHHSRLLGHCVGLRNWKPYALFLAYGVACCVSGVGWAMLRLCEMGDFVLLGPSLEPSLEHSLSLVVCLILIVTMLCLVMPMFWLTLTAMVKAALRNMTNAEQREMAVAVTVDQSLRNQPWPYQKSSALANLCDYLGPVWTWWRPTA
jgi:hypothetical protein